MTPPDIEDVEHDVAEVDAADVDWQSTARDLQVRLTAVRTVAKGMTDEQYGRAIELCEQASSADFAGDRAAAREVLVQLAGHLTGATS